MALGERLLLPWWVLCTHLPWVADRLSDDICLNMYLDHSDLAYPIEGRVAWPKT